MDALLARVVCKCSYETIGLSLLVSEYSVKMTFEKNLGSTYAVHALLEVTYSIYAIPQQMWKF